MYRIRITLSGREEDVARALHAAVAAGGRAFGEEGRHCTLATPEGLDLIRSLSFEHPAVSWGTESFADYDHELLTCATTAGDTAVLAREEIALGPFLGDHGAPVPPEALEWAAAQVAAHRDETKSSFFCMLETTLQAAIELGRFAQVAGDAFEPDEPSADALDAVRRLARLALHVSCVGTSRSRGELDYVFALELTRAVLRAGHATPHADATRASWREWLELLLDCGATIVHAGADPCLGEAGDELLEWAGRLLLAHCLETLAIFGFVRV